MTREGYFSLDGTIFPEKSMMKLDTLRPIHRHIAFGNTPTILIGFRALRNLYNEDTHFTTLFLTY